MRVKRWPWLGWLALLFSLNCYGDTMDKFNWQASESGPKGYPMEVVSGYFYFPEEGSLYVPNGVTLHNGWGLGRSSHLVGPELKPLPNRLDITFFSYTENQFYRGQFALPYETILALFQAGYYSPKEGEHITYRRIVVGIAPGGAVAVWLVGIDRTTEVFFGQAEPAEVDWRRVIDNPDITREAFIQTEIDDSLDITEREALQKNGIPFGRWAGYRDRYDWQPHFNGLEILDGEVSRIDYFNGENGYLTYPLTPDEVATRRALPQRMIFVWQREHAQNLLLKLHFNEAELFSAFKQLGNEEPIQLELRMKRRDNQMIFTQWLNNEQHSIQLKYVEIEHYGAS